jgi:hypothetical protein
MLDDGGGDFLALGTPTIEDGLARVACHANLSEDGVANESVLLDAQEIL